MSSRRMLLNNSAEESFIGTMRIEYYSEVNNLELNLDNNIKIIEHNYNNDEGYFIIGFKYELIVPENFISERVVNLAIYNTSDDYIIFNTNSIAAINIDLHGNFKFTYKCINAYTIHLYDYNYIYNNECFITDNDSDILFHGNRIPQYYENTNNCFIYAYSHILYDLMKYNNIEEGDEEALKYKILDNTKLIISSSTGYGVGVPNVDLGNNNYIKSVNSYRYNGTHITEYICNTHITHLRKGISLPLDSIVYFPDTVTDIDNDFDNDNVTFINESNLKKVVIFGNCQLTYLGGFYKSSLKNIEIYNNTIQVIKVDSFYGTRLKNIIIPSSVINIESWSFYDCNNLESIIIPDNVESIENYNFTHCDILKNVYIGKKLIDVNSTSFDSPIENITINNNNLKIDEIFYHINSLKNINVNYDNPNYLSVDGILFNKNNDSILLYPHDRETTYIIPEGIINIGTYAFNNNPYITCITIPGSINIVKERTFNSCSELKTFIIEDGVVEIEDYFVINGNNIVEIIMPKTIENFGVKGLGNFNQKMKNVSIYYKGSIEEYFNINFDGSGYSGAPILYNINLYIQDTLITELTIPNNITSVSNYNFIGHNSITIINVPKSVTRFGYHSFLAGVTTDTIINYEGTEEEWNKINKSQCFINRNLTMNYLGEIPPNNEIWYTSIDNNIIDVDTEYFDNELLSNTYEDKGKLVFKNNIDYLGALFAQNKQLKEIWLPNHNISGTASAFTVCTNLMYVNNSEQLKSLEDAIFASCENLKSIKIDSYSIYDFAFYGCTSLEYVKISKRINIINDIAFSNCTSLESIDYEGTIEEWNNIEIASDWRDGSAITTIHCSDGDIQL